MRDKDCGIGDVNLWLENEPTLEEIIEDIDHFGPDNYDEVVFCGYGEPTMRLEELLAAAKHIKTCYHVPVRINTNGQADLMYAEPVPPKFLGLIDTVSISLNAKNAAEYQALCQSVYGEESFDALIQFAKDCTKYVPQVIMSVVDVLPAEDIAVCRQLAEEAGASLRVRTLIE